MEYEKKKLKEYIGEDLYEIFKKYECIIAGGFIRNLFTNSEVNDIDVYFGSKNQIKKLLLNEFSGNFIVSVTKKAIMFKINEKLIQLIYINYFENPKQLFSSFDFTICMGAFDFKTEKFKLDENFLKHNSQRKLIFNKNTLYPIISALRVNKYIDKGYKISKKEFIKIMLTINNLTINNLNELEQQLGGMYGESIENIFSKELKKDFSIDKALIELSEKEFIYKDRTPAKYSNYELFVESLLEKEIKYCIYDNQKYAKIGNELIFINELNDNYVKCDVRDLIKFPLIKYKCVKKVNEKYYSFYDSNFEYKIGKEIVPSNNHGLHVVDRENIPCSTYYNEENKVVIKCLIESIEDLYDISNQERVKRLIVLGEINEN